MREDRYWVNSTRTPSKRSKTTLNINPVDTRKTFSEKKLYRTVINNWGVLHEFPYLSTECITSHFLQLNVWLFHQCKICKVLNQIICNDPAGVLDAEPLLAEKSSEMYIPWSLKLKTSYTLVSVIWMGMCFTSTFTFLQSTSKATYKTNTGSTYLQPVLKSTMSIFIFLVLRAKLSSANHS